MATLFRWNDRRLIGRLRAVESVRGVASYQAAAEIGGRFVHLLARESPRDTQRFVRGWIMAGNAAGLAALPIPEVLVSARRRKFLQSLRDQFDAAGRLAQTLNAQYEAWYGRTNRRHDETARRLLRDIRMAEKRRDRARDVLLEAERNDRFVFIGGSRPPKTDTNARGFNQRYGLGRLASIRLNVAGGTGSLVLLGDRAVLLLHNREPHATIVEKKTKIVERMRKRAFAEAVGSGVAAGPASVRGLGVIRRAFKSGAFAA